MTRISAAIPNDQSIYAALELNKNSWLLASRIGAAGYKLMRSFARNTELIARPA
jgi:hypothetical protein